MVPGTGTANTGGARPGGTPPTMRAGIVHEVMARLLIVRTSRPTTSSRRGDRRCLAVRLATDTAVASTEPV